MKVIVCVKQVPDTSGKVAVNPDGTLNRASMATIINPDDKNAIEAALSLKDNTGCEVVVVTMGPPPAEGMLRELIAMGADRGVLVSAREFGGSDTFATSQILAAAIKKIGLEDDDIVMCGRHRRRYRTGRFPDRGEAGHPADFLRSRDYEGRRKGFGQAYAGGRLHDHRNPDPVPDYLHQGAEQAPLHVCRRHF